MVHLKILIAVVAAAASRSDATSVLPSCYYSSGCSQAEYVECGSRRWYCPWSVGDWDDEDMTDCQYGIHGCHFDNGCGNIPISDICWPSCGTGYTLNNSSKQCEDIDECATTTHNCREDQTCENRRGGFTCKCPSGYRLNSFKECTDVNECARLFGHVCRVNTVCINTPGSYECQCKPGFEMGPDGRTCTDIDECTMWSGYGRLCIGTCVNEPGSYSCSCPKGYRLGSDRRTCQDVNECEEGNVCQGEDEMCLNTRGGYRCRVLNCPPGYVRDPYRKAHCKRRVNVNCRVDATAGREQPFSVSYSYLTLPHNLWIPASGKQTFFHLRGPRSGYSSMDFHLELVDASSDHDVEVATRDHFSLEHTSSNEATVSLVHPLQGPQDVELDLKATIYHRGVCSRTTLSKIFIVVSGNDFWAPLDAAPRDHYSEARYMIADNFSTPA